jgi:hypothetical protein
LRFLPSAQVKNYVAPRQVHPTGLWIPSRSDVLSAFSCVHLRPILPYHNLSNRPRHLVWASSRQVHLRRSEYVPFSNLSIPLAIYDFCTRYLRCERGISSRPATISPHAFAFNRVAMCYQRPSAANSAFPTSLPIALAIRYGPHRARFTCGVYVRFSNLSIHLAIWLRPSRAKFHLRPISVFLASSSIALAICLRSRRASPPSVWSCLCLNAPFWVAAPKPDGHGKSAAARMSQLRVPKSP